MQGGSTQIQMAHQNTETTAGWGKLHIPHGPDQDLQLLHGHSSGSVTSSFVSKITVFQIGPPVEKNSCLVIHWLRRIWKGSRTTIIQTARSLLSRWDCECKAFEELKQRQTQSLCSGLCKCALMCYSEYLNPGFMAVLVLTSEHLNLGIMGFLMCNSTKYVIYIICYILYMLYY